ncbi:Protein CBR-SYP-1 [Caenorhabditis briggsae]|uniref:Protein CBR-SYP-1 n=1 Tax=Caenorhabditis briggsae TaxID=6238 RepID=A8WUC0_CAEBR|nr:Protein CBR-SYP-1 [Caenorhabditis briggsae]CAP24082.1 Protein CBR-SYP-1 [Caenorhabditis briggsae]
MDNFTIWVDSAPSETITEAPVDDESNSILRKEIQQTQQYVIGKLNEQETNEKEKGDHSKEKTMKVFKMITTQEKKLVNVSLHLESLEKVCKSIELQLIAMKESFPESISLTEEFYEKDLLHVENQIVLLQEICDSRVKTLNQLELNGFNHSKEDAKLECKKLRESILAAKQKHEKLVTLNVSKIKLQAEKDELISLNNQEAEAIEAAKLVLKSDQELAEKMTEECVSLRSQLVQMEAAQSNNQDGADKLEIDRLQKKIEQIRQETDGITSKLSEVRKETEEAQKKLNEQKQTEADNQALMGKLKADIVALLQKKIEEEKDKKKRKPELQKMIELKKAISIENLALEQARKELEEIQVGGKTVSELKSEITKMQSEIRSYEREIKKATKENEKLIEQIAEIRIPSPDTTLQFLNDTAEIDESEYSQQVVTPKLEINVTPIQRAISRDVFTGAPLMTSTPLHKPEPTGKTRAAARRLEQNAKAKTAELRKKRGGKK